MTICTTFAKRKLAISATSASAAAGFRYHPRTRLRPLLEILLSSPNPLSHHPRFFSVETTTSAASDDDPNKELKHFNSKKVSHTVDPPSKNYGSVVGAWIFCRHGDRTPSRALCPPHRQADEAYFWLTKLPYPSTAFAYKEFSTCFPPLIEDPSGHFMDVHRNPYGFVTHKGLLQMQNNGKLLRQRFDPHHNGNVDEFLKKWRISAYSTNYLRTVLSVQSFLDGLLGTDLYEPTDTRENTDITGMRPQERPVPDHNFIRTPHDDEAAYEAEGYGSDYEADSRNNVLRMQLGGNSARKKKTPKVFVRVRDQSCDNLNAFDRNPDLMRDLVGGVLERSSFQEHDATVAPLAARLANILPGLARKGRSDFSAKTPSGINWVEAADHFICRTSHLLELSMFTDFEHDEQIEQVLHAMTYKALGHLSWRFRQWYQNPQLLAAIAAPPLREIAQQLEHLQNHTTDIRALQNPHENFVTIYSCHDVTLLALLYALGSDFLADEQSSVWREFWPEYASTLAIELVRIDDENKENNNKEDNSSNRNNDDKSQEAQHVIRVLMNGRVVTSTDFLFQKFERDKERKNGPLQSSSSSSSSSSPPPNMLGQGHYDLLTTTDFWDIVTRLEAQGEYDFSLWPTMKDDDLEDIGNPLNGKRKNKNKGDRPSSSSRPRAGSLNSSLN